MSAPTPAPGDESPREGYYPDPSIPGYVRYWNGASWVPGTSRPAPRQTGPAATAPAPAAGAQSAPVEETGPIFFDEEDGLQDGQGPRPAPAHPARTGRPRPLTARRSGRRTPHARTGSAANGTAASSGADRHRSPRAPAPDTRRRRPTPGRRWPRTRPAARCRGCGRAAAGPPRRPGPVRRRTGRSRSARWGRGRTRYGAAPRPPVTFSPVRRRRTPVRPRGRRT